MPTLIQSLAVDHVSTETMVHRCRTMNIEIFHINERKGDSRFESTESDWPEGAGWYWWSCSPGCLPDAEAIGPFMSKRLCAIDAMGDQL